MVEPEEFSVLHCTGTVPSSGVESKMSELFEDAACAVPVVLDVPVPPSLGFFQIYSSTGPECGESPQIAALMSPTMEDTFVMAEVDTKASTRYDPEKSAGLPNVPPCPSMPICSCAAP